jgi:hypothetical protein
VLPALLVALPAGVVSAADVDLDGGHRLAHVPSRPPRPTWPAATGSASASSWSTCAAWTGATASASGCRSTSASDTRSCSSRGRLRRRQRRRRRRRGRRPRARDGRRGHRLAGRATRAAGRTRAWCSTRASASGPSRSATEYLPDRNEDGPPFGRRRRAGLRRRRRLRRPARRGAGGRRGRRARGRRHEHAPLRPALARRRGSPSPCSGCCSSSTPRTSPTSASGSSPRAS